MNWQGEELGQGGQGELGELALLLGELVRQSGGLALLPDVA